MRCRAPLLVCGLVLGAIGCKSPDLQSELDGVRSWTATARLAADRRVAGATNLPVTAHLRDEALAAKDEASKSLPPLAHTDAERAKVRAVLDSLSDAIGRLAEVAR